MADAEHWNGIYGALKPQQVKYDLWLDPFRDQLMRSAGIPILDLGCGAGNDTLYLTEHGFSVIACDQSQEALHRVNELVPGADTLQIDLLEPLPFASESAQVAVADLSLHYFTWADTLRIVSEIRRVLKPSGMLLSRFNSTRDVEYGAGLGKLIEPNYYVWNGKKKRFFESAHLEQLFQQDWAVTLLEEQMLHRYGKPKVVWVLAAQKL